MEILKAIKLQMKSLKNEEVSVFSLALGIFLFMFFFFIVGHSNNILSAELDNDYSQQISVNIKKINSNESIIKESTNENIIDYNMQAINEISLKSNEFKENKLASVKIDSISKRAEKINEFTVYTVKHGDYLEKIAKKFNVKVKSIMELNLFDNPNLIYAGYKIKIPA